MHWLKKVGSRLNKVPLWFLYAMIGLLMAGIVFVWRSYFFDDLVLAEQKYAQSVQVLEQQRLLLPEVQYQVTSLQQKNDLLYNDLQTELIKFSIVDPYVQRERLLMDLDESGLWIISFTPVEGKKKPAYEKSIVELKTTGTFSQICSFLKRLSGCRMPVVLKKTNIQKKDHGLLFDSTIAFYAFQREK